MAQDPTRVIPGDYSATAYDVLSKYDPAFPENVSVEDFFENLQSPEYAAKAYSLLADSDPELVENLSLDEFIDNVKKKDEPVVTESVSDAGSSALLPSTEVPEGGLLPEVNQFGNQVDELGVEVPKSDSPFELMDYRKRRAEATTKQDTSAQTLADQVQAEEMERLEEERKIAAASMPAVPALEGREAPDYVAQLREVYGPYGVRFETSTALGLGEFGSLKAYAVGADGNAVDYDIDIVDGKIVEAQLNGLNEFLQSNARAKGGVDVDKRSLSEKALKVQEMRPVARLNENGSQSTVKMEDADYDGRFFAYPTLFPTGDGFSADPKKWLELEGDAAFEEAQRRGELFEFNTAEEANRFATGEWKEIRETDAIAEQMWAEKGRNYHADEMFLRKVEEKKKEYEFLESIAPGEQLVAGRLSDSYLDEMEIPPAYQQYLTTYTDERGEKKLIARADIEEIRQQKERELAALEQQFDNDNELLRLKEDYDELLGQKRGEVMERAATLNQEGKTVQNRADVASINRFGVPVKGLLNMQPETEGEYNEMLGLLTQYNTGIEQRQVAALQYEKNKLYYDAQHEKLINQEYIDGWEEVWMKLGNGLKRGNAMSKLLLTHYGYYDAIGDEKAEEEAMREVSAIMDSMDTRVGRATSRTNMTGTTESFLERINPMDAGTDAATYTAALTAESLGQLFPLWYRVALPTAIVGGVAGGAYGAAAGPGGALAGFAGGALSGFLQAGFYVGMPVSELALEVGNAILEVGEKKGYDWADPNSALLALNDESVWKEGADRGYKRGVPIALTGMVSNMVMAKAALAGSRVLPFAERFAVGVGTGVTIEPTTEMLGEYLAIQATGEYTGSTANVKEIAAEGLGAIGMGVGFTTSLAAMGYAKDVVTDANFDLAVRLMDPAGISKENVRGERIVSWANKMERLGKIDAEQAEAIRKNVGRRRKANELLGKKIDSRPGSDSQAIGRIVELLEAKEELERSGPNVFGEKIRAITEEIALVAESGKVEKPGGAAVNLSDIRGRIRNRRPGAYKFNGKKVTREDFLNKLQEATPRQLKRARAYNDIEAQRELINRRGKDAISKRETTEVPVGKRTGFGPEVDEEVREITQEVINEQSEGKLDEDEIENLLAPIAAKKARGEKLTDLEQQFAETNSSLLKRVEKDLSDLDKLVADPSTQEQEGVSVIGKLTDRGKAVGKQARKAAKALRAAFPEVKIVLHADDASFVEAAKGLGLKGTGRAFYGFESKEIHVHTGRAKNTTVAHEAFHAALRNSVDKSEVQALMGDFVTTLKKVIPADSELGTKLDKFARDYKENRVDEEYVAEFFGELAAAYPTLDRKGKTAIARFLERLSNLIGIDLTLTPDLTKRDEQILSLLETLAGKVSRGKAIKGKQVSEFQELARSTSRKQTEDNLGAAEQKVSDFTMQEIAGMSENGVVGHFTNEAFDKFLPEFMKTGVYGAGFYFTGSTIIGKHYGKGPNATISFVDTNDMNLVDRDRVATPDELRAAANWLVDNDKEFLSDAMPEDTSPQDVAMMNLTSTPYDSMSERRSKMGESFTLGQLHTNLQANFDEYQIEDDMGVITPLFNEVYPEYQGIINRETESGTVVDMVIWDFDAINNNIVKPTRQFAEAAAKGKVSVADFTEIVYEPTVTPEERMAEMEEELTRTKPEAEAALRAAEQRVDDLATSIQESLKFADASAIPNKFEFKDALQTRFNEDVLPQLKELYGIKSGKDLTPEMKEYLVDAYTNETLTALEAYPDALGWYDAKTKAAMSLMALLHPEISTDPDSAAAFKIVLAVTSNGNKVNDNFVEANRQYEFFKANGRFDDQKTIGKQLVGIKSNLKFTNALLKEMSMEDFVSFLTTKHRVGDINAGNLNIIKGFGVNEEVYGAAIFGPKIGNGFFMNLYGEYGQLTIDRWFMRQYGRMTGTLLDYNKKKFDKADARLTKARKALLKRNSEKLRELIGDFEGMSKEEFSKAIFKTSAVEKNRKVLQSNEKLNEVRLSALAYLKQLEPEVEAPTPAVRRFLVEVFDELQQRLKDQYGIDMEIADLQAVNWYPEKALYQTFKEGQSAETGQSETSDNEQPDYETAAKRLVKSKGITDEQVQQDERDRKQETDRDNSNRESIAATAAEANPNNQEVERLREAVLNVKRSLKPGEPKAAEQRVDVDNIEQQILDARIEEDRRGDAWLEELDKQKRGEPNNEAEYLSAFEESKKKVEFLRNVEKGRIRIDEKQRKDVIEQLSALGGDVRRGELIREDADLGDVYEVEVDGMLFRGVSIEDFNRIKESGFIDTDLRGAISEREGINLAQRPGTAFYYLPMDGPGVVMAIDVSDKSGLFAIGADRYVRSSKPIPTSDIKFVTNPNIEGYFMPIVKGEAADIEVVPFDTPKAAEQRVVEPGVVDVLERYEFKSNKSLAKPELAPELNRNLQRFGFGVKQYGTRMNDFRVVSLDTGRAVDPGKIIAAGVEERAARVEEQRTFEEEQRARELEDRIIEIYDADERPFTGRDFESQAAEQKQKIEAMSQPNDTMRDIVAKGREMGFRDSAIRAVLMKRYGRDSTESINTALTENADIFTVIPKPFGNVVGGLDVGRQIYAEVRAKLNEFMTPKSPGRMTKKQRADRVAELREAHPDQSKVSDSQLLRRFPRPKTTPTRAEMMAEALEILKANRRFKEQPEKVQKELLVGFATSLKSRANKGVQNLLSQIRRDLKERKKGAKTAREVQAQLRTLINEVLPKAEYSKAQVAKLTKVVNEVNEDNYIVKAQKVLDLVEEKREQIRKATIREIIGFVKRSAKTYKTPGGRIRTRGLDAPGRAFFLEANRVLAAVFKKDQTDIMNIGFNLANNPEVDIATAKLMNGENLTVKEQMLIDQKDAYDLFAPLSDMSLEQVEAVLEDLKVTAGFSRLNLKTIRMERAARLNALRQGVKDSVEGNWGGTVTKEVEKDGETKIVAKDRNELATDRANKKSLKDILGAQGLQGKYRTLVEWAAEGQRMTPLMFGLGEWWAHLGTLTSVFGEFFNENIYNKINRMKEENLRGEYAQKEKLNDIANSIDGITNGYKEITELIFTGGKTRVLIADKQGLTLSVKAGRRKFTTDELMRIYALSKNPIQRAKLERQGFTDKVMADIEEFLDPRLTEFVDKTVEYLSGEYYEGINDVYVKVNDVNLGYMENYFPTRTQFQGDLATQSKDQLLSSTYSGPNSQMADALKERVDTGSDILMNEGLGFHGELGNHLNTMERFKAYSVGVQEINAILSDSFTVSLSELLGLGRALNDGVSAAIMPDIFKAHLDFKYVDTLMSMMVGAALSFKPMQIVKQMTSAIAGVKEYQYGKEKNLPVDILMFSMDFARLLPKLILEGVSLSKYKGPVSTMIEDSATLRRRIEDNFGGDLYGMTSGVSGRTRRVTANDYTLAAKALKGLAQAGGAATSSGDVAGVMGYLPAYMRDIQNGMSKEEAIEKFNQYNKTQQSRRESERAPIQTYQDGLSRLFTAFTSSQLLYLNEIVTTSNNMLKSIRKGEKIKASDSRGYALALVGYSVMFTLATNMWKLMFGDDEEKEKAWLDVGLSPAKNYFVIPVLGSYMNDGYNWIVGNNYPSQMAKDPLQSTKREIEKAYKKEDYVRIGTEITEIGLKTNLDMFRGMMDIAKGQPMDESFYDVMGVPPSQRPD